MAQAEASEFTPYTEVPTRLPKALWWVLRIATMAVVLGTVAVLFVKPQTGLDLFWKLLVPVLPIVFVVAPGFWRQVCPMALTNQIPRMGGFGLARTLSVKMKSAAFLVAVLIFFAAVVIRHVLFNANATALAVLIVAALILPFLGGLVFKGRSGWCGTFCPLAPIQKAYGQAPLVMVRNGYCQSCVGCQKNCYDFNPRAAIHADLADPDPWYAGHRALFAAALPGLIVGFFTAASPLASGFGSYLLHMASSIALALGLFMALASILRVSRYKLTLLFSTAAFVLFYWFVSPSLAEGITEFTGLPFPGYVAYIFFAIALGVGVLMVRSGLRSERLYELANAPVASVVGVNVGALRAAVETASGADLVADRGTGMSFVAGADHSLLEGLESAGVKIDYGCRMGMCGADPIAIVDGEDNLSAPSATELETLERLGLKGRARMACVCRAMKGGVTVDTSLDPRSLPEPEPDAALVDLGEETGVQRVIIIGNGAAGMSAADEVRKLSSSCSIEIVAREREGFYNRMAIARLLHGSTAMGGIGLQAPDWTERKSVSVLLNTTATAIDKSARQVMLGTGETLNYDKLILAQGSSAVMPPVPGHDLPGCFVLREAADAMNIRAWRQTHECHSAVVLGGGVLGIEAADALRQLNLSVSILQRGPRLMDRQLDERGSEILTSYLKELGVAVITDANVAEIRGDGRVSGVVMADGQVIEAEIIVACAGIRPNVDLAKEAGLAVGRGVKIDGAMRTSDPDIFAVGDLAELPGSISGLWAVSTTQGRVAAAAIFGCEIGYSEPNTLVSLKMDGIDVKGYGAIAAEGPNQEAIVAPSQGENEHRLLVVEDGKIVGAVFVGPSGTGKHVTELIDQRPDLGPVLDDLRRGDWSVLGRVLD
ncbi:FAD-dependent oxidoreductase [Hoeflea sp. AS60]|uniref:FAD-dependent oxidoreductase n=1 Tax=Hoeflea sp. AS60 TaxID=3135780 RepID=UPI00317BD9F8